MPTFKSLNDLMRYVNKATADSMPEVGKELEEVFKEATYKILGEQQGNTLIDEEQKIKLDKKPNDSEQGWSLWTYC